MAWNLTLQDASFRGVSFEVQSVEDRGEKALCVHEYPYRSGAEVEDLGRKPRVIPVTAIFWGVAYESRIKALVAAFEDAKKVKNVPVLFDIKVLPKTMTDGYSSWWRVGDTEVSERKENLAAYADLQAHLKEVRKY